MEKKQRQNRCQLKIYPNVSKLSKKSGLLPFYVKLTFQKKKVEFRLYDEYDVKLEELRYWDEKSECFLNDDAQFEDLNIKLVEIKLNFKRYMRENNNCPNNSLNEIMGQILELQKVDLKQTIINYIDKYYKETIS